MKFVSKIWGYEKWIDNNELYCGKLLHIVKGKRTSLHYHKLKTETLYVQDGELHVISYDNSNLDKTCISWKELYTTLNYGLVDIKYTILRPGDSFKIVPGLRHTLIANLTTNLFEFSTQHFDSDSYRIIESPNNG